MPELLDLNALDPHVLLVVAALLVLVQTSFVTWFVVPAGQAAFLCGVMIGLGRLDPILAWLVLAPGAILGAAIGYLIGRRYGEAIIEHPRLARHHARLTRARSAMRRHAGLTLLAGRLVAVLRAVTPTLAGAVGMTPARFLVFDVVGGFAWAALFLTSGYVGGITVPDVAGDPVALAAAALVAGAVALAVLLRRRRTAARG